MWHYQSVLRTTITHSHSLVRVDILRASTQMCMRGGENVVNVFVSARGVCMCVYESRSTSGAPLRLRYSLTGRVITGYQLAATKRVLQLCVYTYHTLIHIHINVVYTRSHEYVWCIL